MSRSIYQIYLLYKTWRITQWDIEEESNNNNSSSSDALIYTYIIANFTAHALQRLLYILICINNRCCIELLNIYIFNLFIIGFLRWFWCYHALLLLIYNLHRLSLSLDILHFTSSLHAIYDDVQLFSCCDMLVVDLLLFYMHTIDWRAINSNWPYPGTQTAWIHPLGRSTHIKRPPCIAALFAHLFSSTLLDSITYIYASHTSFM